MNPADMEALRRELGAQANTLKLHNDQLTSITGGLQEMSTRHDRGLKALQEQLQSLTLSSQRTTPASTTSAAVHPSPVSGARLPHPERYSGNTPCTCRPFLIQCSLAFDLQPSAFPTERSRVAYIILLLTGRAREWATAEWEKNAAFCLSVSLFASELKKVFDHVTPGREAARGLFVLTQGTGTVSDYSIKFRTLAAESDWNSASLIDAFHHGLSDRIKDELAARDMLDNFDALVDLAIRIDARLCERRRERGVSTIPQTSGHQAFRPTMWATEPVSDVNRQTDSSSDDPEPMQLGRTRLSVTERQRRIRENKCLYCGQDGHFASSCPVKGAAHQSSRGRW